MSLSAESFPEDHLRAEEKAMVRKELCRSIHADCAPISDTSASSVLSGRLEGHLLPEAADSIHLSAREHRDARDYLHTRIRVHRDHSHSHLFFGTWRFVFPRMIAACGILLILGNGVAYASYDTVPGDRFYPVKVNIIEPLYAITKVTDEEKVEWATVLVRRRLTEADLLLTQNRLTSERWNSLNGSIATNVQIAGGHIPGASLKNEDEAADLLNDLNVILSVHGAAFADAGKSQLNDVVAKAADDLTRFAIETARVHIRKGVKNYGDSEYVEKVPDRALEAVSDVADNLGSSAKAAASQKVKEENAFIPLGVRLHISSSSSFTSSKSSDSDRSSVAPEDPASSASPAVVPSSLPVDIPEQKKKNDQNGGSKDEKDKKESQKEEKTSDLLPSVVPVDVTLPH